MYEGVIAEERVGSVWAFRMHGRVGTWLLDRRLTPCRSDWSAREYGSVEAS